MLRLPAWVGRTGEAMEGESVLTPGSCCTKDAVDWVVVAGATRTTGTLVAALAVLAVLVV